MKRSMLYTGIGYLCAGAAFLALALATECALTPLFWGLAGGGIGPGAVMVWKYLRWSRPDRREEYEQRAKTSRSSCATSAKPCSGTRAVQRCSAFP